MWHQIMRQPLNTAFPATGIRAQSQPCHSSTLRPFTPPPGFLLHVHPCLLFRKLVPSLWGWWAFLGPSTWGTNACARVVGFPWTNASARITRHVLIPRSLLLLLPPPGTLSSQLYQAGVDALKPHASQWLFIVNSVIAAIAWLPRHLAACRHIPPPQPSTAFTAGYLPQLCLWCHCQQICLMRHLGISKGVIIFFKVSPMLRMGNKMIQGVGLHSEWFESGKIKWR